jgi:hypothetical protein
LNFNSQSFIGLALTMLNLISIELMASYFEIFFLVKTHYQYFNPLFYIFTTSTAFILLITFISFALIWIVQSITIFSRFIYAFIFVIVSNYLSFYPSGGLLNVLSFSVFVLLYFSSIFSISDDVYHVFNGFLVRSFIFWNLILFSPSYFRPN